MTTTVTVAGRKFDVEVEAHPTLAGAWSTTITSEDGQPHDELFQQIMEAVWAVAPPSTTTENKDA